MFYHSPYWYLWISISTPPPQQQPFPPFSFDNYTDNDAEEELQELLLQEQEQSTDQQQQNIGTACGGGGGYDVFGSRKITTDDMDYARKISLQLRYIDRLSPELPSQQIVKEILNGKQIFLALLLLLVYNVVCLSLAVVVHAERARIDRLK